MVELQLDAAERVEYGRYRTVDRVVRFWEDVVAGFGE
jgi:hypothetical protein